jgi:transketolase
MRENDLKHLNNEIRKDIIKMLGRAKSGHPGGSLSCVEIISTLYNRIMRVDPDNPKMEDRDIFILSKGHAAPTLYSILSRKGFFKESELNNLRKFGAMLQGHPDKNKTPGVEASTGSLGQGTSLAVGMALGYKTQNKSNRVFVITGDGEVQEGQFWEAAMAAANYKLDNFTLIIDKNGLQIDGKTEDVMDLGNLCKKMESFGFKVYEIDGHDIEKLTNAFEEPILNQPKCIIAHTVKGKGVSFMENQFGWHGKAPNIEEVARALSDLEGNN